VRNYTGEGIYYLARKKLIRTLIGFVISGALIVASMLLPYEGLTGSLQLIIIILKGIALAIQDLIKF
jgi:uncharacterized membrane protein